LQRFTARTGNFTDVKAISTNDLVVATGRIKPTEDVSAAEGQVMDQAVLLQ